MKIENVVPVKLAKFVVITLKHFMNKQFVYDRDGFREWLECNYNYSPCAISDIVCRISRCF